jgi:dihydrofolate synthase/folylpolyglutamate synthase
MVSMVIRNFEEARLALRRFYNVPGSNTYTLDRMRALVKYLGNPQESLKIVHVAGTSGKSSTAYYTAALLQASGASVGLSVSPHVISLNERVQINRTMLPEPEFCKALGEFMDLVLASGIQPSYFETMVAFAFWQFARSGVDYAVIEVGLGGLMDGTNVISRPDKVCIITDIGFDHTNVLGNTLAKIAAQKAGIIRPHNHVFMYSQAKEIMDVVRKRCGQQNAELHEITAPDNFPKAGQTLPLFQQRNLYLAEQAADYVLARDNRAPLSESQRARAAAIYVPGRMDIFHVGGKTLVVDGAHNEQKMQTLLESMREKFPNQPVAALVAFVSARDNRWQRALDMLTGYTLDITAFDQEPDDMPKAFIPPQEIANYLARQGKTCSVETDLAKAYEKLLKHPEPILLITGSLYLFSGIRPLIHE